MTLTDGSPEQAARAAKQASRTIKQLPAAQRNECLEALHRALQAGRDEILAANARDMEAARKLCEAGKYAKSSLSRLDLGRRGKFEEMVDTVRQVKALDDPLCKIDIRRELDTDLVLTRQSCPIGVLLVIFEARPEVIINVSALAIKTGNAAILKGGKESSETFVCMAKFVQSALRTAKIPEDAIQLVTTRDAVDALLKLDRYIDLIVPRGSAELIRRCQSGSNIPVLGHADGKCHVYVHHDADPQMATTVVHDSKTHYPAACNSLEVLLVHEDALETILPGIATDLLRAGVELRCDDRSKTIVDEMAADVGRRELVREARGDVDFDTEYLDLILAIKTIPRRDALRTAIAHVNEHGSEHTDAILTSDEETANAFLDGIDSACKFWNCSTRMSDGMRFGLGTEVGISTDRVHARGPVGLEGLTIYEFRVVGKGQIAASYGPGKRQFTHKDLAAV